ncbi:HEAT repeat domain-containing protein [Haloferula sp.]|uniref:HEAT repeat domain-containing protein n=1 Tax=Haloferula sp. TaxID=2497595 RepID=UPI003C70D8C1
MSRLLAYALILILAGATVLLGIKVLSQGGDDIAQVPEPDRTTPDRTTPDRTMPTRPPATPHLVRQLVDPSKHLEEQIEAVRGLPDDLTAEEFAALIAILHQPAPPKADPGRWYALQNEIMEVLRQPRFTWEGYSGALADLVADRNADPVMRDYAAQHLALYLGDRADQLPEEDSSAALDSLLGVLRGSRESHEMVSGTTLMALCDLNTRRPELLEEHRSTLGPAILALVTGERSASMSNQVAAIQAAGRMGFPETLPAIRSFASGEAPNPSVELSSIAALGYFADPEDKALLTELAEGDTRLRFAARSALKNYDKFPPTH